MTRAPFLAAALIAAGALAPGTLRAGSAASADVTYALITPPSSLEIGCEGPCACAVQVTPTFGSFALVPAGVDSGYAVYDLERYIASYNDGPGAVMVTGSGRFRIGGSPPAQQVTLDLLIEGRPAQHFDSGLVPDAGTFPALDLRCAAHHFACHDTVVRVDAAPASAGVTGRGPGVALEAAWPNPFRGTLSVVFSVAAGGTADLAVYDLAGRRVQVLARGAVAGRHLAAWTGRREDGTRAPAGVYWLRLDGPRGRVERRAVELE